MADDLEPRVRELERCQDRIDGRLSHIEDDMRTFRPMPIEAAKERAIVERLVDDVHEAHEGVRRIEDRMEARDERERERDREQKQRDEDRRAAARRDRYARWIPAAALTLTFISMTVGWLVLAL